MATVTTQNQVPAFDALMNPTLYALKKLGGSASIDELLRQVIRDQEISPETTAVLHTGGPQTELSYRLAWTRTYLKKFGLLDNSQRGVWSLTAAGRATESVDPQEVVSRVREEDRAERGQASQGRLSEVNSDAMLDSSSPEDPPWSDQLLQTLRSMPPDAFERLCQRMLRESGFIEVEVTGRSGDGGIDGNGIIRLAGLISFPVLFQCKRYSSNVSSSEVRDFRGAMQGRADKGLILTTGGFTSDAHKEATRDGAPAIDLIDGGLLVSRLRELELGVTVTTKTVEVIEVDTEWFENI